MRAGCLDEGTLDEGPPHDEAPRQLMAAVAWPREREVSEERARVRVAANKGEGATAIARARGLEQGGEGCDAMHT